MNKKISGSFGYSRTGNESLESSIKKAILENKNSFSEYFEAFMDVDDARITLVDDSLEIDHLSVSGDSIYLDGYFLTDYYAGCKDQNSVDAVEVSMEFELDRLEETISYEIEIPKPWRIDN